MLWTLFVILMVLWLIAVFSGHVLGGLIHPLLVIAIIVMLVNVIKGRKKSQSDFLFKYRKHIN